MTGKFPLMLLGLAAVGAAALASCSRAPTAPVLVLAASSLTESLQTVAAAWTAQGHPAVTFSFDASSRLAKQVEAGAPADAFFSADTQWMDYLDHKGLIDGSTRRNLVGNTLVVAVPSRSSLNVSGPGDLVVPAVKHLALAGESVPAGIYARAALERSGDWEAVQARVVRGDSVRTVLSWVATGEADAGVVYGTDARVEPRVTVAFTFPASSYPQIVYPAAVIHGSAHAKDARDFLDYCQSEAGMKVFIEAGFSAAIDPV